MTDIKFRQPIKKSNLEPFLNRCWLSLKVVNQLLIRIKLFLWDINMFIIHLMRSRLASLQKEREHSNFITQINPKSRLGSHRFSQKRTDEFDLFTVKCKKANKTNSSVLFWGEKLADHKLLSRLTDLYVL